MPVDDLLAYRDRFPILADTTYLISHSLGPMPRDVEDRLAEYARMWRERGVRAWGEGWWQMPMTVGDQIGRIVGAPAGSTVMHQNVTVAEEVVLSCFSFEGERNRIVYEDGLFPSVRYLQQAQVRRGAEIVVCEDDEAVADAIDERTLLVPISHVLYKTGEIQDVGDVIRKAREAGAYVLLDCYQSAGVVPLDVTALDVDFAVGGSVKWLLGGPGNGWLYVRPDLAERLEPAFAGWQAHARPFEFEPTMDYAEGAARFLSGTPNVPALYAGTPGYSIVEEVGIERIRLRSMALTALLVDLVDEAGFELTSPRDPARRGGSVVFKTPEFAAVQKELAAREIIADQRPDAGIRFGPHFFNTEDELRHAVAQCVEIVESGAYERHLGAAATH
jgi:kynureninase